MSEKGKIVHRKWDKLIFPTLGEREKKEQNRQKQITEKKNYSVQQVFCSDMADEYPDISKLRVVDLKQLCTEYGLDTKGKKAELQAKLLSYFEANPKTDNPSEENVEQAPEEEPAMEQEIDQPVEEPVQEQIEEHVEELQFWGFIFVNINK